MMFLSFSLSLFPPFLPSPPPSSLSKISIFLKKEPDNGKRLKTQKKSEDRIFYK